MCFKKKIFILALFVFICAQIGFAHPPGNITLDYDSTASRLLIDCEHIVKNNLSKHFINKIEVFIDGKKMILQQTESQTDSDHLYISYDVPGMQVGAEVTVILYCNIFGKKKAVMVIE